MTTLAGWAVEHRLWCLAGVVGFGVLAAWVPQAHWTVPRFLRALLRRPPKVWEIPERGPCFLGRDADLKYIRKWLTQPAGLAWWRRTKEPAPMLAVCGEHAIGKTQAVLAYALQYRRHYKFGAFIPAGSKQDILSALSNLATTHLEAPANTPAPQHIKELKSKLANWKRCLLIFDNVTDPEDLEGFLPPAFNGHVLITSLHGWPAHVKGKWELKQLDENAAASVLHELLPDSRLDQSAAIDLAKQLDRSPLALQQAAAYLREYNLSVRDYRQRLDREPALLALGKAAYYKGTVTSVVMLSKAKIAESSPAAAMLLELCALLAPDQDIPLEEFLTAPGRLPEPVATAARETFWHERLTGPLYNFRMLARDKAKPGAYDGAEPVGGVPKIHLLTQKVIQGSLADDGSLRERIGDTITMLTAVFPHDPLDRGQWSRCAELFLHAEAVLDHAHKEQVDTRERAVLLIATARYLLRRKINPERALELHEDAWAVRERLYQNGRIDRAEFVDGAHNVAYNLRELGKIAQDDGQIARAHELFARARKLDQETLDIRMELFPHGDESVARSMTSLAGDYRGLGDPTRARRLDLQALIMRRRLRGNLRDLARSYNNLAMDYRMLGDLRLSLKADRKGYDIRKVGFGDSDSGDSDSPDLLLSLDSLAETYRCRFSADRRRLGDLVRSWQFRRRARAMRERLYSSTDRGHHR